TNKVEGKVVVEPTKVEDNKVEANKGNVSETKKLKTDYSGMLEKQRAPKTSFLKRIFGIK
ncbi:MAG: hypothetical protein RSB70_06660, partial [Clostridium sp.]